jgi:hypothetical protein
MPVILSLFLASLAAAPRPSPPGSAGAAGVYWNEGFGRAALWNDGAAEVSTYRATDVRYGVPRSSQAVLIVVAEDLLPDRLVKADHPERAARTLRVLKLNHVRSIRTGVYAYQQMLSAFLGADRLDPVKLTMTSHEWCGNSFAEWRADRSNLEIRTYFEDPGDRDVPLSPADAVFYDSLPLRLRGLDFARTRTGNLRIMDSVFSSRPEPPRVEAASLEVIRAGPRWRVTLRRGGRVDVFEFEEAFPHRLARWQRSDGGSLDLVSSQRFRYWEKNAPGDESLLSGR